MKIDWIGFACTIGRVREQARGAAAMLDELDAAFAHFEATAARPVPGLTKAGYVHAKGHDGKVYDQ